MFDVIIAGDWVVDEYWYLVQQHSEISSHTGFVHYRVSSKPSERILDLCSAGHIARVLFTLRSKPDPKYRIWGVGDWNHNDTSHLLHLIHAHEVEKCQASRANFSLSRELCDQPPAEVRLIPLRANRQTTRVVRLYQSTGSGFKQLNRIDWEVPPNENPSAGKFALPAELPKGDSVKSIVIHDLRKGAVTAELIEALNRRCPQASWYVRTKHPNPPWLKVIKKKIALFMVGPEVAEPGNPWGSWLSGTKISYQSFTYLRKIGGKATLVLSDEREIIGRVNEGEGCITAKSPLPKEANTQIGWPSALLASLVHEMQTTKGTLNETLMKRALRSAHRHAGVPAAIISEDKSLDLAEPVVMSEEWSTQEREWKNAMNRMGIIPVKGSDELVLEVWRGASDLPGYVACIQEKRDLLIEIGKRLRAFTRSADPARSLSILLQADPGSGKTHLAKLLARKFDFSLQTFDITTMLHRDDLLDLFDAIATEQANKPQRRVLVVVDEINAHLDAAGVYGAFLAPLEQGTYVRRGRVFSLRPCVWIFAGTHSEPSKQSKSEKISDFEDRLTAMVKLDYKSLRRKARGDKAKAEVKLKAKLEQVYLGATMIHQRYYDVEKVEYSVLKRFYDLNPEEAPARKIRKMVEELHNVQRGVVTMQNVLPDVLPNSPRDKKLVRIIYDPSYAREAVRHTTKSLSRARQSQNQS